jgi:hypothetical protein
LAADSVAFIVEDLAADLVAFNTAFLLGDLVVVLVDGIFIATSSSVSMALLSDNNKVILVGLALIAVASIFSG